jgi:hypothetical protein
MRLVRRAKAFQRRDLVIASGTYRHHTGAHNLPTKDYRAGSALSHAATELRATQPEFVVQNEQKRGRGVYV